MVAQVEYVKQQLANHFKLFYSEIVSNLFESVEFVPYETAITTYENKILIPYDIPVNLNPSDIYIVNFNETKLTLWNRIKKPIEPSWKSIPDESNPLWYQHSSGTLIPAWNIFGNLFSLLTFAEDANNLERDEHGRFNTAHSPREKCNLLEVPAFNEAAAVLTGGMIGVKKENHPLLSIQEYLKPPVVVLSHDCDVLYGDDYWTQLVRLYRVFLPLASGKLPKLMNFWWILRNMFTPKRFYYNNVSGMIEIEKVFGYNSTFYLLNGNYGRFGSRSGIEAIDEMATTVPNGWDLGIHYNYDTFLNESLFNLQRNELNNVLKCNMTAGRAHYLKFDSFKSFEFLHTNGITVDESVGYTHSIGYKCGIAGCFYPYDRTTKEAINILEIPITVMDAAIVEQYDQEAIPIFSDLIQHLYRVGGALSIVFHPGQFYNPEHKHMLGIYQKMLIECRQVGAVSKTALELLNEVKK